MGDRPGLQTGREAAAASDASRDAISEVAADWIVRLGDDDPRERAAAREGFEAWRRADPRHEAMAREMERFLDGSRRLADAPPSPDLFAAAEAPRPAGARAARQTIDQWLGDADAADTRRRQGRRRLLGLGAAIVLPTAVWTAWRRDDWFADVRTATGEQRAATLPDGSRLTLGSASAVDLRLTADERRVELLHGEVLIDVARGRSAPFVAQTAHGRIRALGTRFIVRRDATATWLTMIESTTSVQAAIGGEAVIAGPGQRVRLDAAGVTRLDDVSPGLVEDAYLQRRLVAQNRPLGEVLAELARQREGVLRFDRAAMDRVRVSAVLPLDDTDRALALLSANFPQLRVRRVTPWWVSVELQPAG